MDLRFLKSNRFWVAVVIAVGAYLQSKGWLGEEERNLIVTLGGLFIGIKTVDRASEKLGNN